MKIPIYFSQFLVLLSASISDYQKGIVSDVHWIIFLVLVLIENFNLGVLIICGLVYCIAWYFHNVIEKYIGGADVKLLIIIMYKDFSLMLLTLNFACILSLIYLFVSKRKKLKFIPFISISYLVVSLC